VLFGSKFSTSPGIVGRMCFLAEANAKSQTEYIRPRLRHAGLGRGQCPTEYDYNAEAALQRNAGINLYGGEKG
jgi:hypothetical protein